MKTGFDRRNSQKNAKNSYVGVRGGLGLLKTPRLALGAEISAIPGDLTFLRYTWSSSFRLVVDVFAPAPEMRCSFGRSLPLFRRHSFSKCPDDRGRFSL